LAGRRAEARPEPAYSTGMELDLTGGQPHGYVRRKVAQANGRASDGAAGEEGTINTMLNQVADGVWVRQSAWVWSNAIAVRGEGGLVLVDPGIDGSELNELADDVDRLGIPVVAGFSTHPHWDHLLWHSRFGDVRAMPPPAAPRLPVKPGSGHRRWRRRAHRASLSS
jgi:hypothetical protein